MHMADALVSPAVGGVAAAAATALGGYSAAKLRKSSGERHVPLMGAMGAFVFAAQMINFAIPGTGSSGHLGGGLLLAIALGPYAAFVVMASVLAVQALLFGDGGLVALGCNVLNLALFPCFVAYPLIYRPLAGNGKNARRVAAGAFVAAVVGLLLGALAVVLETVISGVTKLSFGGFAALMLPIHLAIGAVEGLATAAVVLFLSRARPEALYGTSSSEDKAGRSLAPVMVGLLALAALGAGAVSQLASDAPDGLEWSLAKIGVTAAEEAAPASGSAAGLLGCAVVMAVATAFGLIVRWRRQKQRSGASGALDA